jgi:hypothetical protein
MTLFIFKIIMADDVSLKTVLDAVNRQSKNIEAIVEAKVSEKIGVLSACRSVKHWRANCPFVSNKPATQTKARN